MGEKRPRFGWLHRSPQPGTTKERERGGSARLRRQQRADNRLTRELNEHKLPGCDSVYERKHRLILHGPYSALSSPNGGPRGPNRPDIASPAASETTKTGAFKGPCNTAPATGFGGGVGLTRCPREPLARMVLPLPRDEQQARAEEGASTGTQPSLRQSEPRPPSRIMPRKGSVTLSFVTGAKRD